MTLFKKAAFIALAGIISTATAGNTVHAAEPLRSANLAFTRDLSLGKTGNDVKDLQSFLIEKGYLKIPAATGYFGALTRTAVQSWQKALGIAPAAGYFGPLSRARIAATPLPNPNPTPAPTPLPEVPPKTEASGLPLSLTIPKLGVTAAIEATGLTANNSLDAPKTITEVGWYKLGALPGAEGSAVITGHVARIQGGVMTKPGVFYDLGKLEKGDVIQVRNDKGETITFAVRESRVYEPGADAREVFHSETGGSRLNLITCEGTWDPIKQSYSGRLVVFADRIN